MCQAFLNRQVPCGDINRYGIGHVIYKDKSKDNKEAQADLRLPLNMP